MHQFRKEEGRRVRSAHDFFPRVFRRYPRLYRQYTAYRIRKAIRQFVAEHRSGSQAQAFGADTLQVSWREISQGVRVLLVLPGGPLRFFLETHRSVLLKVLQDQVPDLAIVDVVFVHE